MPSAFTLSAGPSLGSSSVIYSASSASVVKLSPSPLGITSAVPMLDPSPTPSPTPTDSASPEPSPAPTVTVTQTVAPPGPSEVSGTVKLDGGQFLGLSMGLVLILLFVVAVLAAQMKRP